MATIEVFEPVDIEDERTGKWFRLEQGEYDAALTGAGSFGDKRMPPGDRWFIQKKEAGLSRKQIDELQSAGKIKLIEKR